MDFVLFLHIALAIFLIGPLTVATMTSPRAVRGGVEGLPLLRWLARTSRIYGLASLLVFLLGIGLVAQGDRFGFGQPWLSASMTLFIVAIAVLFALVEPGQRAAITAIEGGGSASAQGTRILAGSIVMAVCWIVIVLLMVYKWGA